MVYISKIAFFENGKKSHENVAFDRFLGAQKWANFIRHFSTSAPVKGGAARKVKIGIRIYSNITRFYRFWSHFQKRFLIQQRFHRRFFMQNTARLYQFWCHIQQHFLTQNTTGINIWIRIEIRIRVGIETGGWNC